MTPVLLKGYIYQVVEHWYVTPEAWAPNLVSANVVYHSNEYEVVHKSFATFLLTKITRN